MSDTANPQTLIERYLACYNAFDVEGMLALLSDEVHFENHSGGALTVSTDGREAFRALAEQGKALFREREQRVTAWQLSPDAAVVEIDYRGTLAVDLPNGMTAGSVLALQGQSEFAFSGGKISRIIDRS